MLGVEMLHQDEGHAGVCGQVLQQFGEGVQSPGRGADTYYRKCLLRNVGLFAFRFLLGGMGIRFFGHMPCSVELLENLVNITSLAGK